MWKTNVVILLKNGFYDHGRLMVSMKIFKPCNYLPNMGIIPKIYNLGVFTSDKVFMFLFILGDCDIHTDPVGNGMMYICMPLSERQLVTK